MWTLSDRVVTECSVCRSLPKLSSQDEDGPTAHGQLTGVQHFEPIPHDHDYCERVVINVSIRPGRATAGQINLKAEDFFLNFTF